MASAFAQLFENTKQTRAINMKTTLKSTLAALTLAILALAFSGCESNGGSSGGGTHNMGTLKNPSTMSNRDMPGR